MTYDKIIPGDLIRSNWNSITSTLIILEDYSYRKNVIGYCKYDDILLAISIIDVHNEKINCFVLTPTLNGWISHNRFQNFEL